MEKSKALHTKNPSRDNGKDFVSADTIKEKCQYYQHCQYIKNLQNAQFLEKI